MQIMSGNLGRGDEDQEPELRAGDRPPVKKSMASFLAEFEERLKSRPDEPATGALRLVVERAGGLRRSPHEATSDGTSEPPSEAPGPGEVTADAPEATAGDTDRAAAETAAVEEAPDTAAATPGELRRLRGRRRRKHRHRAH